MILGILDRLRRRDKAAVEPVDPQVLSDARRIIEILRVSPFIATMEMPVLRFKFSQEVGLQGDEVNDRISKACQFLKDYKAVMWGGGGSAVCFDRKRLTMPILVR